MSGTIKLNSEHIGEHAVMPLALAIQIWVPIAEKEVFNKDNLPAGAKQQSMQMD
jgi:hypothetical protein